MERQRRGRYLARGVSPRNCVRKIFKPRSGDRCPQRVSDQLRDDRSHSFEDSVTVTARPIDASATCAATEMWRGCENVRRYDVRHFFARHLDELAVALAATRHFKGRSRPQIQTPEDLNQLLLEIIGTDEHRPWAHRCQPSIPGQQPPTLGPGLLLEHTILRPRFEIDAVKAEKPQPPRQ